MSPSRDTDVLVVGGGFFGTYLATHAARRGARVELVEAGDRMLQRASLVNQARVHNGYHYPRSILTGIRSRANFERFAQEFPECIDRGFTHLYAIARDGSHVTAQQFALFCDRIGAEYREVDEAAAAFFDGDRIEAAFEVKEWAFDSEALRVHMEAELEKAGVRTTLGVRVERIAEAPDGRAEATLDHGDRIRAGAVINCTYAALNGLAARSGLQFLPLKQELVEILLLRWGPPLGDIGWTILDGPFSSSLPFPAHRARSLYHVRYSTHGHWFEGEGRPPRDLDALYRSPMPRSNRMHMICDGARYVPALRQAEPLPSLWTVRTKLPGSAQTDSRPILFRSAVGLPNLHHVLGGKIDNVYDVVPHLDAVLDQLARGPVDVAG
ncbi:MAG: FAD-binding oxidoreductase [Flavobacteriales bacterium]|nr:FAD-binding oxidoreductase [Flavobacteriales bacterium]MCB9166627.1 FAD-binding oxidoreductase [Flavobacteriales bacterium]